MNLNEVGRAPSSTVAVAMSGGVDSSVCAAMLVEQGYNVQGIMLRLWSESGRAQSRDNRCCTRDQMIDAHFVARQLGISFEVIDIRETFRKAIVDLFIDGYAQGTTPNPCLACNRQIRFGVLLDEAIKRGASYLATGHYAKVSISSTGKFELRKGVDPSKDQSYVLSRLTQEQLGRAMFPLGSFTKVEVRALAEKYGLRVSGKKDSQDLCFIADGNYRRFLRENAPSILNPGPIVDRSGKILGNHTGLADFTVGQRKGLNVTSDEPLYVIEKNVSANAVVVGPKEELGSTEFMACEVSWISGEAPSSTAEFSVKTRYKSEDVPCLVTAQGSTSAYVKLMSAIRDVTPGQAAVFYDKDRVAGSGVISPLSTSIH